MEKLDIIIYSEDAFNNVWTGTPATTLSTSTPYDLQFNFGSVYDTIPAIQRYADAPYCYIKVKYFQIKETPAQFTTNGIYTLKVELNSSLPQTIQSYRTAITNQPINIGLQSSRVISVIPTGSVSATYGDSTYDNEYVKCPNIFRGMTNIQLKKQDNSLATHLDKTNPYFMVISVGFNIDPELFNNAGM